MWKYGYFVENLKFTKQFREQKVEGSNPSAPTNPPASFDIVWADRALSRFPSRSAEVNANEQR